MASKRRNMFHKNKTQETTEEGHGGRTTQLTQMPPFNKNNERRGLGNRHQESCPSSPNLCNPLHSLVNIFLSKTDLGLGSEQVVIVGNGAVGKSSMIQRYCKGTFTKDYKKTIGVDFLERQIECDGEEVRLMLWDTAGQEEFDAITKAYYRGAQACVLAFSTTDRDSFEAIHSWKKKVEDECGEIPTVLVQNKIDLLDQSVVDPEEVDLLSRAIGCRLLLTSVKEDVNVNTVFRHLASRCLAELRREEEEYSIGTNGLHPLTINAFGPTTHSMKPHHGNGTIVLRSGKLKNRKKKNVFKNTCKLL